jgi:hypothetical protein
VHSWRRSNLRISRSYGQMKRSELIISNWTLSVRVLCSKWLKVEKVTRYLSFVLVCFTTMGEVFFLNLRSDKLEDLYYVWSLSRISNDSERFYGSSLIYKPNKGLYELLPFDGLHSFVIVIVLYTQYVTWKLYYSGSFIEHPLC